MATKPLFSSHSFRVTDQVLSLVLLKCPTATDCWYDIKSTNESSNKWSCFIDGNNAIVDVFICVMFYALWKEVSTQDWLMTKTCVY